MLGKINYLKGDATNPRAKPTVILHCCNDIHDNKMSPSSKVWGAGFVLAISKRWKHVEEAYRKWDEDFYLGQIQIVKAEEGIAVCNMIGQRSTGMFHHIPPVRYEAVNEGLYRLSIWLTQTQKKMRDKKIVVSCPRFCCGLAGGSWDKVEELITTNILTAGFDVDVYDPE
jgi:hypothetical protein